MTAPCSTHFVRLSVKSRGAPVRLVSKHGQRQVFEGEPTIRAALLGGPGDRLAIRPITLDGPREDEVLVRIVACGICGTDVHFCDAGAAIPTVLGHEGAGIVERCGRRVRGVRPGDHVVLSFQSCGACSRCRAGHPADCAHFWELNFGFARLDGSSAYAAAGCRGHFFGQSSFASHALATGRNVVRVDPDLPLATLAPLGCGLQTGAGTVLNTLGVRAGESVAVLGTGAVGLAAVMAARIAGAGLVIAVDWRPARLRMARSLGASHALDPRRIDVVRQISRIAGGGVDHIVDSTGDDGLIRAAGEVLNRGGRIARLAGGGAVPGPGREALDVIQGDAMPQRFIPRLIRHWQRGEFPFDRLIRFYPFNRIARAVADARASRAIKAVLRMEGG